MTTDAKGFGARIRALVRALRESTWASMALRAAGMAAALVVLAFIGRCGGATKVAQAADHHEEVADAGLVTPVPAPAPEPVAVPPPPPPATAASAGRASPDAPVILNVADEAELRRLPGVGAKRAQAILALRSKLGRFQRVEDLLRVKGVGRGTIKKWRPLVRVDAPPAADAGAPPS